MFEVIENMKKQDGIELTTYQRLILDATSIEVEAGTTGLRGGDAGHGGRTYLRVKNDADTNMRVSVKDTYRATEEFIIELAGDAELECAIKALKFMLKVLEDQKNNVFD